MKGAVFRGFIPVFSDWVLRLRAPDSAATAMRSPISSNCLFKKWLHDRKHPCHSDTQVLGPTNEKLLLNDSFGRQIATRDLAGYRQRCYGTDVTTQNMQWSWEPVLVSSGVTNEAQVEAIDNWGVYLSVLFTIGFLRFFSPLSCPRILCQGEIIQW